MRFYIQLNFHICAKDNPDRSEISLHIVCDAKSGCFEFVNLLR